MKTIIYIKYNSTFWIKWENRKNLWAKYEIKIYEKPNLKASIYRKFYKVDVSENIK